MEQAITESFKISTLAGLLVCAITILGGCIVFLYKQVDKTDKGIIQEVINTNKQLSETNSKLHSKLVDVDGKLDTMGKKVDKIEFIVVNSTNKR